MESKLPQCSEVLLPIRAYSEGEPPLGHPFSVTTFSALGPFPLSSVTVLVNCSLL